MRRCVIRRQKSKRELHRTTRKTETATQSTRSAQSER